ncbi:TPA: hypothetical protein QDB28_006374 [Burkholderia vietnamiensis]|nr:hypothetical protein [Burkholderia vietnamiensis]
MKAPTIYHYDRDSGEYLGDGIADPSPLEPGVWHMPAHSTRRRPPKVTAGKAAVFDVDGQQWKVVMDQRGDYYRTSDGERVRLHALNVAPEKAGLTVKPRPSSDHVWSDGDWVKTAFALPPGASLDIVKGNFSAQIDDLAASVYAHATRFRHEYEEREAAALAYKKAMYAGSPGTWITSYAKASGKDEREAADFILMKAKAHSKALSQLAAQRMRKSEVMSAADAASAKAAFDDVMKRITQLGHALK